MGRCKWLVVGCRLICGVDGNCTHVQKRFSKIFYKRSQLELRRRDKSGPKPRRRFSLQYDVRNKEKKTSVVVPKIWHRRPPYREKEIRWPARLGAGESKRRSKRLRECGLGFGDEVCRYHREKEFYDLILKVGLHILKVHPVESKQPRPHRYLSNASAIVYIKASCEFSLCSCEISNFQAPISKQISMINP